MAQDHNYLYKIEKSKMESKIDKYKIVYFPAEQKFSIWLENVLVKEWFDTKEDAIRWIKENLIQNDNQNNQVSKYKKVPCLNCGSETLVLYPGHEDDGVFCSEECYRLYYYDTDEY